MSLHIYNSNNRSWKMYTNTLSSISGDDLTIKPYDGKNISLEVSGNNAIFIKKGDISYNLSNLITGTGLGTSATIVSGSDASFTNIDVSGNLNPLNANGSSIGLATKIWKNAYISDLSVSSIDLSGNLNPLNANSSSLGTSLKYWNNAYIRDVSVTNIDVTSNLNPLNANSSSLGSLVKSWANAYIRDVSVTNLDVSGNLNPLNTNVASLGLPTKIWKNAYINDISVSNIDVSGNLNPLNANNSSLGASTKYWRNAYITDVSVSNIDLSGDIIPLIAANSSLGSLLKRWKTVYADDIILNKINGATYSAGGGSTVLTSITTNVVPSTTNTYSLGSTTNFGIITNYWNNAYINNLRVVNRAQEMNLAYIPSNISIPFIPSQGQVLGDPFTLSGTTYSNTDYNGYGSALNSDGTIFAIASSSSPALGCVRVYKFNDISWQLMGPIIYGTATNKIILWYSYILNTLQISYDGRTLATLVSGSTATFGIYKYNDVSWNNTGYLSNGRATAHGAAVLSGDGNTFAMSNDIAGSGGIVYAWKYINNVWTSIASIANTFSPTFSSWAMSLGISYDGNTLIGSSRIYPSNADQQGYARIFKYNGTIWQQFGPVILGPRPIQEFGWAASMSYDGLTVSVGGYTDFRVFKYNAIDVSWQLTGIFPVTSGLVAYPYLSGDGTIVATWYSNKAFIWKYRTDSWVKIVESSDGTGLNGNALSADGTVYATCHSTPTFIKIHKLNINGNYYGLAKDAYPSLKPSSSGVKAVQTWTGRVSASETNYSWRIVCWSPERQIFVALANDGSTRVMTSSNGITWTGRTSSNNTNGWNGVCWSPELMLFVAVAYNGTTNRVMTSPDGTNWTGRTSANETNQWRSVCWSPELGLFVAVADSGTNRVMTSPNGTTWTGRLSSNENNEWFSVCWSPELSLFVAVAFNGTTNRVMTSPNGITWTGRVSSNEANTWYSVCWSGKLGLFAVVAETGSNKVMTSPDGITWTGRVSSNETNGWNGVCWSAELGLFAAVSYNGTNRVMSSPDGINWTGRLSANETNAWVNVCWSAELGIFAAVSNTGSNRVMTSSLKCRPPTSYNVFDSTFNSIDETGKWTFQNILTQQLTVNTTVYSSDDRVKHNEVIINNGLDVIDRLTPKFYQKTLDMLDTSYNGDLSGHTWIYEAGLIAQEVLQVPDLSFAVSGGDIYDSSNNLIEKEKYTLAYNSIFAYGLAAIKELHTKVKTQEISIMNRQTIINSLTSRIEALDSSN
jgi:hypothetical protein